VFLYIKITVLILGLTTLASSKAKTNFEILREQTDIAVNSLLKMLPDSVKQIELQTDNLDAEKRFFLSNIFAKAAGEQKITISFEEGEFSIKPEILEIQIVYNENTTKMIGFKTDVSRLIKISFSGFIQNNLNKNIYKSFNYSPQFEDSVWASQVSELEKSPYTFTKGILKNKLGWTRYIEPGIVIVAVSGLIYLFYSMRY
jgi:hypothetical protein